MLKTNKDTNNQSYRQKGEICSSELLAHAATLMSHRSAWCNRVHNNLWETQWTSSSVDDPWGESDPDSTQTSHCLNDPPKAHLILEKERGRN